MKQVYYKNQIIVHVEASDIKMLTIKSKFGLFEDK